MDKKKILIIVLCIVILGSIMASINILTKDEPVNNNIEGIHTIENDNLLKDTKIEKLSIENQSLIGRNNSTMFIAKIINKTDSEYYVDRLYVTFKIDGKLEKILLLEDVTFTKGQEKNINMTIDRDVTSTTEINYVIENDEKVE